MISDEVFLAIQNDCHFDDYTYAPPHNESKACNDALGDAYNIVSSYVDNYDVLLDVCYPAIAEQELRLKKTVRTFSFF